MTREKAIGNVLRDYSRSKDKGTRAVVIERVLRMREDNARRQLLPIVGYDESLVNEILAIARGTY